MARGYLSRRYRAGISRQYVGSRIPTAADLAACPYRVKFTRHDTRSTLEISVLALDHPHAIRLAAMRVEAHQPGEDLTKNDITAQAYALGHPETTTKLLDIETTEEYDDRQETYARMNRRPV